MRILLRAGKDPFAAVEPEEVLAKNVLGLNAGNALFASAVHRILSVADAVVVADNFAATQRRRLTKPDIARISAEFDVFVAPMANAFRPDFLWHLRELTKVIEGLTIPVVVVGVGAQFGLHDGALAEAGDQHHDVARFVRAVLDRSATIGVRGDITRSYLRTLGFGDEHVDVIGCPSLSASSGPDVVKAVSSIGPDSPLAMNVTAAVPGLGELVHRHVERYRDLDFIPQENGTLAMMLWGDQDPESCFDDRLPHRVDHVMYRSGHMRFFVDPSTWIDYMRSRRFAFGTRIHGNIAALRAGTPAYGLAFDSRTLELCEYHQIPHRTLTPEHLASIDAAELYDEFDATAFNAARSSRRESLESFLGRNGLGAIDEFGDDAKAYDARLASTTFPDPVTPVTCATDDGRAEIVRRLQWLRQGSAGDRRRKGTLPPAPILGTTVQPNALEAAAARLDALEATQRQNAAIDVALVDATERIDLLTAELSRAALQIKSLEASRRAETDRREAERRRTARLGRLVRSPIQTVRRRLAL